MLDWTTFAFSILAPISMLVVGKQIGNIKIKGHKIFVYYVIMGIYLLISIIWELYFPEQVSFTVLFIYFWMAIFIVVIFNKYYG